MPAYQTGRNKAVDLKVESTLGTPPGASGATRLRVAPSSGLTLKKATVLPTEFRADGMTVQARHGSKSVDGEYMMDLIVGAADALFEAGARGTWFPSFTYTNTTGTSVTAQAGPPSTFTFAAGSLITAGIKVGDIVRMNATGGPAGNNNRNLRVTAVTATLLTVAETLTLDATPRTTFTLTVLKRLVQGTTSRSFTFEEKDLDASVSKQFVGCRIAKVMLSFKPDATVQVTFGLVGQDMNVISGGSYPYFTSPTVATGIGLVCSDGKVRVNGVDSIDFTGLDITIDLGGATQPVIGSMISPDVFLNPAKITGQLTGLRSDLSRLGLFTAETQFEIGVLCVAPMSEPKDCVHFYFGNCKYMGQSDGMGQDNALIETLPINIGLDEAGGAHVSTMFLMSTSAA